MKTPRFRTHREAVIVVTPTRITLPSSSAAADLGTIGRYCILYNSYAIDEKQEARLLCLHKTEVHRDTGKAVIQAK